MAGASIRRPDARRARAPADGAAAQPGVEGAAALAEGAAALAAEPSVKQAVKSPKAAHADECRTLEQLPNVGPSIAADLRSLGIVEPAQLAGCDALALYRALCVHTGKRQDPCVLDTFMAVTDFMRGAAPAPWWAYTAQRKALYGQLL